MKEEYDFQRYLRAKKSVDDRALNRPVWQAFGRHLPAAPRILEVGAGVGTMIERLIEQSFIYGGSYTAVDNQARNLVAARQRFEQEALPFKLTFEQADILEFIKRPAPPRWDVLIAHAFLDLMDIETILPELLALLETGGLFYLSLNFDGATIFEPVIDLVFDRLVEQLYHQTMDKRQTNGRLSGDSKSGRHLFHHIKQCGAELLAAGSSDWVVFAGTEGYPGDEAYFLHFIIQTIYKSLQSHPEIDSRRLANWVARRRAQIEAGELVYIAHQLDFLGSV